VHVRQLLLKQQERQAVLLRQRQRVVRLQQQQQQQQQQQTPLASEAGSSVGDLSRMSTSKPAVSFGRDPASQPAAGRSGIPRARVQRPVDTSFEAIEAEVRAQEAAPGSSATSRRRLSQPDLDADDEALLDQLENELLHP
jgi:hypothetical protein